MQTKKCVQLRQRNGWHRADEYQIRDLVEHIHPGQGYARPLREVTMTAIAMPNDMARFASIRKCLDWTHKPFTSTHRFFEQVEMEEGL